MKSNEKFSEIGLFALICIYGVSIFLLTVSTIANSQKINKLEVIIPYLYDANQLEENPVSTEEPKSQKYILEIHNYYHYDFPEVEEEVQLPKFDHYNDEIMKVCEQYDFYDNLPNLIYSMMQVESDFNQATMSHAGCVGLMQVSPYWHKDRIERLGVKDIWDPYSNILVATDFLSDLYYNYANNDIVLAVMMYNMDFQSAKKIYYSGRWSQYAKDVFDIYDNLPKDDSNG